MPIENEIKMFIESEENNGALLITGKWGCGKSYLIKKIVSILNSQKPYAIAVISLFGVDNIADLNAKVKDAYLEFTSDFLGEKAQKVFSAIKKVAIDSANITAAALPESGTASAISTGVSSVLSINPLNFINVKNTVGKGEKQQKFALVFDDFERCNIRKHDLLGVINEYAENKDIKVIIVADEAKIKDDNYSEFKEKVVAQTLQMSSDYTEIINSIIENYKTANEEYRKFLLKSKECIIGAFIHSGYDNLRTLKSCLIGFERFYIAWVQAEIPMDDIENTFYKFCAIMYEVKKGNISVGPYGIFGVVVKELDSKKRESEIKKIKSKYLEGTFEHNLSCIIKWLVLGEWDEQACKDELRKVYFRDEMSYEEKFIRYSLWDLEQVDIDKGMPSLITRAYKGESSCDELIALLNKIHAMKTHVISFPCEIDYEKLEKGFDQRSEKVRNGIIKEPQRRTFTENDKIDKEAISLYNKIVKMQDRMFAWECRKQFICYLHGDRSITHYRLKSLNLESFDDELYQIFVDKYLLSTNAEKRELCWALLEVDFNNLLYSTSIDREITYKNFNKLILKLKQLSKTSGDSLSVAIHQAAIELLKDNFNINKE